MNISLASLRKAAHSIQGDVTIPAIAAKLGKKPSDVRRYISGVSGLRQELGIVKGSRSVRYDYLVTLMSRKDVAVNPLRLSVLAGTSFTAARVWCERHRYRYPGAKIMDMSSWKESAMVQHIRWYCCLERSSGKKPSVYRMALDFDRERANLYKFIWSHNLQSEFDLKKR